MPTFRDVLQPVEIERFTRDYLHRSWIHLNQPATLLQNLVSLGALSGAIQALRVSGGRLRLTKNGELIPPRQFLDNPDRVEGARINVDGLMRQARAGATLVVDYVDELLPEVWAFADDCERQLGLSVTVNLYLSWGSEPGFAMHWDDHDVLILQIEGRKRWTVCSPTLDSPVRDPRAPQALSPRTPPVFDDDLVPGAVLYLPRGWWHVARAVAPPSIHLTVGLETQTGIDFLQWVTRQLSTHAIARQDVPIPGESRNADEWLRGLRSTFSDVLAQTDIVDRFRAAWLTKCRRRVPLDLRDMIQAPAEAVGKADSQRGSVQLLESMTLSSDGDESNGTLTIKCGDIVWHSPLALKTPLSRLNKAKEIDLALLTEELEAAQGAQLRLLLETLAASGAVVIRNA